ncbi:MAG: hypothetical protein R3C26_09220 [Calditrichia bacterium]
MDGMAIFRIVNLIFGNPTLTSRRLNNPYQSRSCQSIVTTTGNHRQKIRRAKKSPEPDIAIEQLRKKQRHHNLRKM